MGKVMVGATVSLDRFVADDNDDVGPLFDWYGDGDVAVTAGEVGSQALEEGLVDELQLSVVPVLFGSGKRFFRTDVGADAREPADRRGRPRAPPSLRSAARLVDRHRRLRPLVALGVVLVVRWGGRPGAGGARPVSRLAPLRRRRAGGGAVAGVLAAGAGGRLVMRLLALTSPDAEGSLTEAGEFVGEISVERHDRPSSSSRGLPAGVFSGVLYALAAPAGRARPPRRAGARRAAARARGDADRPAARREPRLRPARRGRARGARVRRPRPLPRPRRRRGRRPATSRGRRSARRATARRPRRRRRPDARRAAGLRDSVVRDLG